MPFNILSQKLCALFHPHVSVITIVSNVS